MKRLTYLRLTGFWAIAILGWVGIADLARGISPQSEILSSSSAENTTLLSQRNLQSYAAILWSLFRRRGSRGRRRDDRLCSLWPTYDPELSVTWSDRPVFMWQGSISQIQLSLLVPGDPVLWTREIAPDEHFVTYSGEEQLEPGKFYKVTYTYIYQNKKDSTISVKFKVLDNSEKRERIQAELATLNAENTNTSLEELTLQRASYFADLEFLDRPLLLLWNDMMRELLAIADTSDEQAFLREQLEQYTNESCKIE